MAFLGPPAGPARIRVSPRAHGAAAGGRAPGSRPAPLRSAPPGPGPGSGRAPRTVSLSLVAPGPRQLYEPAAGPSRARPALSRGLRFARRSRGPVGPFAAPLATWCSRRQPGPWGCAGDVNYGPCPRRPCWAQCKRRSGGGHVPRPSSPLTGLQSGRPNTNRHSVFGPRPKRCRQLSLPCRMYRVTS